MVFERVAHNMALRLLKEETEQAVTATNATSCHKLYTHSGVATNFTNCTCTPAPAPPLSDQHIVFFLGMFCMAAAWFDLRKSLEAMTNKKLAMKLTIMFCVAFIIYFLEWLLTMGTVITAICPGALWALGITHYSIKVIVSYSYCVRTDLALYSSKMYSVKNKWMIWILQGAIIVTAIANAIKVFLTYSSKFGPDGKCLFTLGQPWAFLDEIMFGIIDFSTIVVLVYFYFSQNLKGQVGYTIARIIAMSMGTFMVTIVAILINWYIPSSGLTSSIMDITTDVLTMMRVYTKPNMNIKWQGRYLNGKGKGKDAMTRVGSGTATSTTQGNSTQGNTTSSVAVVPVKKIGDASA